VSEGGRGFVFRVEDQDVAPFPNVPGDGGDYGGRHRARAAGEKQVSEGEWVLVREFITEEMPHLAILISNQREYMLRY
jgi:hypothetical protein